MCSRHVLVHALVVSVVGRHAVHPTTVAGTGLTAPVLSVCVFLYVC